MALSDFRKSLSSAEISEPKMHKLLPPWTPLRELAALPQTNLARLGETRGERKGRERKGERRKGKLGERKRKGRNGTRPSLGKH